MATAVKLKGEPHASSSLGWANILPMLNPELREAFDTRAALNSRSYGARAFLLWLANHPLGSLEQRLFGACLKETGGGTAFSGEVPHARAFHGAFDGWLKEFLSDANSLKRNTRHQWARTAKHLLEQLSSAGIPGIPAFSSDQHRVGRPAVDEHSGFRPLGEAPWPELNGLEGMERERHALGIVRQEYSRILRPYFKLYRFGQQLLDARGTTTERSPGADLIRQGILLCRAKYDKDGRFFFGGWNKERSSTLTATLRNPRIWLDEAGLDLSELHGLPHMRGMLALQACLGPVGIVSRAVFGVLLCDTGWNRQTVSDLPRNPFVFSSTTEAFIAGGNFIKNYKGRRGADVHAYISEAEILEGSKLETAVSIWEDTAQEFDRLDTQEGYARLSTIDRTDCISTAAILSQYKIMSDGLLEAIGVRSAAAAAIRQRLFAHIGHSGRIGHSVISQSVADRRLIYGTQSIVGRRECKPGSIRKTFQLIKFDQIGSVSGVRPFAGHDRYAVLMPHYLNSTVIISSLDENIRNFQNALEAVATRNMDPEEVSLRLTRSLPQMQIARHMAEQTGISATLGLAKEVELAETPTVIFIPNAERLAELYLIHRKLRQMQASYPNPGRFRAMYLPIFAVVKAVGREVFRRGLGPRYSQAARHAAANLRAGLIALPSLEV